MEAGSGYGDVFCSSSAVAGESSNRELRLLRTLISVLPLEGGGGSLRAERSFWCPFHCLWSGGAASQTKVQFVRAVCGQAAQGPGLVPRDYLGPVRASL